MSVPEAHSATNETSVRRVNMNLEVQTIPVSDVDRSKGFYDRLGWRLDDDAAPLEGLRIVQFTPLGSGTSVTFGQGLTVAAPGSAEGGLIVSDIEAAHSGLVGRGIDVSDVWHGPPFPVEARHPAPTPSAPAMGLSSRSTTPTAIRGSSRRSPRGSQAGSTRRNGIRVRPDLESALRRAEAAHVEHQKRTGRSHLFHRSSQDEDWPAWYASYMVADQAGSDLPA